VDAFEMTFSMAPSMVARRDQSGPPNQVALAVICRTSNLRAQSNQLSRSNQIDALCALDGASGNAMRHSK